MWHHVSSMVRYWAARIQCLILAKAAGPAEAALARRATPRYPRWQIDIAFQEFRRDATACPELTAPSI